MTQDFSRRRRRAAMPAVKTRAPARNAAGVARRQDREDELLSALTLRDGDTLRCRVKPLGEAGETIAGLLERNARRFAQRAIYREKRDGRYRAVTWAMFRREVEALTRFLQGQGIEPGDRVAVISRNRGEMLTAEFAVMGMGAVYVPIFPAYVPEQSRALLEHSGAVAALVSDAQQLEKIAGAVRLVVAFDPLDRADAARFSKRFSGRLAAWTEALAEGRLARAPGPRDHDAHGGVEGTGTKGPAANHPCLMMYTSGTGGELKGVVLSHDAILSQQRALARIWSLSERDRFFSYLPWHHSFGGIFEKYNALYNGAALALDDSYGKDFPLLLANWKQVRPTLYFSVPAIYQQLVDHVELHPEEEERIFHRGMKFVFTAAAPLPARLSAYFAARGIPVVEGWGLTETSPCCTVTDLREPRSVPGMVGYPIPGVEVRLAGDGEILVRGPNVMLGYHENPQATREALPGDGWFHTGDLGEFVGQGLRLVARKDRIFKLLNGERVIPTPLENHLAGSCRYIRHVVVAGSGKDHLTALIFPNFPLIDEEFGADREAADRAVRESFLEAVRELNEHHPVRYERIQALAVVGRTLTVDRGELTPSMKVRVANVLERARGYVEAVYEPSADCDCRFLQRVVRLTPDNRRCFFGKDVALDRCHECGLLVEPEDPAP